MSRLSLSFPALVLLGAACSTTSESFLDRYPGHAVTKGRVLRVESLTSNTVTALADGAAFSVDTAPCRVLLRFADGQERLLELQPSAVLVCGAKQDFVLQPATRGAGGGTGRD